MLLNDKGLLNAPSDRRCKLLDSRRGNRNGVVVLGDVAAVSASAFTACMRRTESLEVSIDLPDRIVAKDPGGLRNCDDCNACTGSVRSSFLEEVTGDRGAGGVVGVMVGGVDPACGGGGALLGNGVEVWLSPPMVMTSVMAMPMYPGAEVPKPLAETADCSPVATMHMSAVYDSIGIA